MIIIDYQNFYNDGMSKNLNLNVEFRNYIKNQKIKKQLKKQKEKEKEKNKDKDINKDKNEQKDKEEDMLDLEDEENIDKNKLREGVVFVEEEEEEEESDSDDYYCNSKFYEKNPNKVGENNDKYKFYTESVKDDDYDKSNDIVIPYGMD